MADDDELRIQRILERMLESGCEVAECCSDCPELIPIVQMRWDQLCGLDAEIDEIFPRVEPNHDSSREIAVPSPAVGGLPQIPGYEVHAVLGHGGMGVVYRALHVRLHRPVALKMLLAGAFANEVERARFRREAEAIAKLQHACIVQVYDSGDHEGHPFFTMELVEGGTLADAFACTPQPASQAAALVAKLAGAIHVAHQAGIVHRDLKPGNILLSTDGSPKISDFGLAHSIEGDHALTISGIRVGTPTYMAPEQALGKRGIVGPATDIYALGTILYEALTGRPPFKGESASDTERQVISQEPVPPSRLNPKVPRDLETICLMCLRKDPAHRYGSAADLAADLERFQQGVPVQARRTGLFSRVLKWARRRPAMASLIGVVSCFVISTVVFALHLQRLTNDRHMELALRQDRARAAIEQDLSLAGSLRDRERWDEAHHVIQDANSRLSDVNSSELAARLNREDLNLQSSQELDEIRQTFAQPDPRGYDFKPANEEYHRVFQRVGLGPDVSEEVAAEIVRSSAIRKQLLIALDSAAFVAHVGQKQEERRRYLSIARVADRDQLWSSRFRNPQAWTNREALLQLASESSSDLDAPSHELVITAVLLSGLGANEDAIRILREAEYRSPQDFWLNLELGNSLDRGGYHEEACEYFRAAIAVRPDNFVLWTTLGVRLAYTGRQEQSLRAFQKATELNPRYEGAWRDILVTASRINRWQEAAEACQRILEMDGNDKDAQQALPTAQARSFVVQAKWHEAADAYEKAVSESPDDQDLWYEYAAAEILANDLDGYRQCCQHMQDRGRAGRMRSFLVSRACTLANNPLKDIEAAAALSSGELNQWNSEYWSLTEQGALQCRLGHFDEAIPLLQRSISKNSKPAAAAVNWLWLAVANKKLGHTEESRQWLDKATAWLDSLGQNLPPNSAETSFHLHNWLEAQVLRQELTQ